MTIEERANNLAYSIMDWATDIDEEQGMDTAERMLTIKTTCTEISNLLSGSPKEVVEGYMLHKLIEATNEYIAVTKHWNLEVPQKVQQALTTAEDFFVNLDD